MATAVPPADSPFTTAAARAAHIDRRLAELYPATPIPLDHTSPYTLLVAVLLSAQCTDKRVNLQTPGLFAKADNPRDMVKLSVADSLSSRLWPAAVLAVKVQPPSVAMFRLPYEPVLPVKL